MSQPYTNIVSKLRAQVTEISQQLIVLLEEDSTQYSHLRELLQKYEEALSASDLLESAAGDISLNAPETQTQEPATGLGNNIPWGKKGASLESTVVSSTRLQMVESESSNKIELRLAVIDPGGRVTEIEITPNEGEQLIIGRTRSRPIPGVGLTIDDTGISSKHCEINWTENKGWTLIDFGTTNGTELNGEPVSGEACMTKIGQIRLGDSVIKFFPKDQQEKFMETMRLIVEH